MARYWSRNKLHEMLTRANVPFIKKHVDELTHDEWDELGDWLYYKTTGEKDHVKNRQPPTFLKHIKGETQ
jgi:hypothetical protein